MKTESERTIHGKYLDIKITNGYIPKYSSPRNGSWVILLINEVNSLRWQSLEIRSWQIITLVCTKFEIETRDISQILDWGLIIENPEILSAWIYFEDIILRAVKVFSQNRPLRLYRDEDRRYSLWSHIFRYQFSVKPTKESRALQNPPGIRYWKLSFLLK